MGNNSSLLNAPLGKTLCFLAALALACGSIHWVAATHIQRFAPNEIVVWVNEAAFEADWNAASQSAVKARPKQPTLKIPQDYDPDRT